MNKSDPGYAITCVHTQKTVDNLKAEITAKRAKVASLEAELAELRARAIDCPTCGPLRGLIEQRLGEPGEEPLTFHGVPVEFGASDPDIVIASPIMGTNPLLQRLKEKNRAGG